ncbi:MAG: D-alanyl-D-alanine carboxypeptidase [Deltaproteobacteria bacterium]|nr:D-alanyl-D-alanine carboxypeptidase [Deltaproteobacteria bacterium]
MVFLARFVFLIGLTFTVLTGSWSGALAEVRFQVNAKSAALFDCNTEQFLLEQNGDEKIEPASFTKLMTLYLAQDGLKDGIITLDDQVLVSRKAWTTGGSKMFIEVGKRVGLEDLLKGIAVVSGNDACVALAEHLAGREEVFVGDMNRKSEKLGFINTVFKTPHGLPAEGQFTTAHDMALLAGHYIKDYPHVLNLHSIIEFTYNNITQPNRNRLLKLDEGVDGLKTGYIETAGYHLVATAQKEERRLIAVVMGTASWDDRENEALKLLNYGFRNFVIKEVFKKGDIVKSVSVKGGKDNSVDLIAHDKVIVSVSRQDKNALKLVENISSQVVAPVRKGEILGKIIVTVGGENLHQVNLLAKEEVPKGWQAYWRFGVVILGILGLAFILQRIVKRRKSKKGYTIPTL